MYIHVVIAQLIVIILTVCPAIAQDSGLSITGGIWPVQPQPPIFSTTPLPVQPAPPLLTSQVSDGMATPLPDTSATTSSEPTGTDASTNEPSSQITTEPSLQITTSSPALISSTPTSEMPLSMSTVSASTQPDNDSHPIPEQTSVSPPPIPEQPSAAPFPIPEQTSSSPLLIPDQTSVSPLPIPEQTASPQATMVPQSSPGISYEGSESHSSSSSSSQSASGDAPTSGSSDVTQPSFSPTVPVPTETSIPTHTPGNDDLSVRLSMGRETLSTSSLLSILGIVVGTTVVLLITVGVANAWSIRTRRPDADLTLIDPIYQV